VFQWSTGPVIWNYNFPMDQTGPVTAISSSYWAEINQCLRTALYKGSDWSSD